jgi:glycosyltransferase involved in cell wall biosynthesis
MIIGKPLPGKENYLSGIAAALNVQDRVDFAGQVPQKEVFEAMLGADVFIHPSSREGGSGVVGEATAVGVPVVCFKGTGAAAVLELSGGHGVQVDASGDRSVNSLAAAVIAASRLGNRPSPVWLGDRYTDAEAGLLQASSVSPSPGI